MNTRREDSEKNQQTQYQQSLSQKVNMVQQEARLVLPGIQALFGFQLVSVFSQGFQSLSAFEKCLHLFALLLVASSAVLVMAPAAYHRQAKHQISAHFVEFSSRLLAWSMAPLALGTCLDIYLVTRVIVESIFASAVISGVFFIFYSWTWFVYPRLRAAKIAHLPTSPDLILPAANNKD
ncbi:MAG: DUF6328 family protein [Bdellovibrionota bacterium]